MISYEEAHRLFSYDPDTGVLTWRVDAANNTPAGSVAGGRNRAGYIQISIGEQFYQAHRLAFFMSHGRWPAPLDHINRQRDDNRLANLREATRSQNAGNAALGKRNTSGFKGVSWNKPLQKWCVYICVNSKNVYLGCTSTAEEGAKLYDKAAKKYFGEFAWLNNAP